MARSFSNAKVFSVLVADGVSNAIFRRGYAAGTQGVSKGGAAAASARSGAMLKRSGEEAKVSVEKESWVPDPKTGYYRPANGANEVDPAELRAMFLKNKH